MSDISGLGKTVESIAGAIRPFTDPVLTELGEYVADRVKFARWKQSVAMARRAEEILVLQGLPVHPVPAKILAPLLEGAAVEEEELVGLWSNMLARAAAGELVHPSYITVLRQLTPQDVVLLNWIYKNPPVGESPVSMKYATVGDARAALGWEMERTLLVLDILQRENLIEIHKASAALTIFARRDPFNLMPIGLTTLGVQFVVACTIPPERKPSDSDGTTPNTRRTPA